MSGLIKCPVTDWPLSAIQDNATLYWNYEIRLGNELAAVNMPKANHYSKLV